MPAKILLVEDDNNLREIYQARLMAEGYTIVTAQDGEEALGVAKTERPDLIVSDVMMPRVSGFEMLDILRNTDGLKDTKVIMLTALGQADDKTRANSLGADRYLVKSQVTLEDIVKTAHELIEGVAPAAPASPVAPVAPAMAPPAMSPAGSPAMPPMPSMVPAPPLPGGSPVPPAMTPPMPPSMPPSAGGPGLPTVAPTVAEEQANIGAQIQQFMNSGAPASPAAATVAAQDDAVLASAVNDLTASSTPQPTPPAPAPEPVATPPAPAAASTSPAPTDPTNDRVVIANKKIIQPILASDPKPPIDEILAREEAAARQNEPIMPPTPTTTFSPSMPGPAPMPPAGPVMTMPETSVAPAPTPPAPAPSDPSNISL